MLLPLYSKSQKSASPKRFNSQVIADRVNIRSSPGLNGSIVGQANFGQKCIILGKGASEIINGYRDNWYKTSFNNDSQNGYVFGQFISKPSQSASASNVFLFIAEANTYSHQMKAGGTTDLVYDKGGKKILQFYKSKIGGNIPDKNVVLLQGTDCNSYNVLMRMSRLVAQADDNDVIIFYYNGHGNQNILSMYDRVMYHSEIANILKTSRAKRKLWIADSCHSGSMQNTATNSVKSNDLRTIIEHHDNDITFISSSKANELSWSVSEFYSGVFTNFWLEGLKGAADVDQNRIVTLSEAFAYAYENVQKYSQQKLSYPQTPYISGVVDMQLPLSVLKSGSTIW